MRFYNRQHHHYWGIDLHAKTMYASLVPWPKKAPPLKWHRVSLKCLLEAVPKCRGSPAVAGDLVRMWIEVHQPDVAPEVAEHEDDLIGRGDWRSAWKVRGHQHFG